MASRIDMHLPQKMQHVNNKTAAVKKNLHPMVLQNQVPHTLYKTQSPPAVCLKYALHY